MKIRILEGEITIYLQADQDSSDSCNNFQSDFEQEHKTGNALVRLMNGLLIVVCSERLSRALTLLYRIEFHNAAQTLSVLWPGGLNVGTAELN